VRRICAENAKTDAQYGRDVRRPPIVVVMTEQQSSEVEKVLLYIGDARTRARRAADAVAKDNGDSHVVDALRASERELGELYRRLSQGTFYAVPDDSLRLSA